MTMDLTQTYIAGAIATGVLVIAFALIIIAAHLQRRDSKGQH